MPGEDERQIQGGRDAGGENGRPRRAAQARRERERSQAEDAPRLEARREADEERCAYRPPASRLDRGDDPEQGQETVRGMARVEDVRGEARRDGREPGEREQAGALDAGHPCDSRHEQRRRRGQQHGKRARRPADGAVERELKRPHLNRAVGERAAPVGREQNPAGLDEEPRVAAVAADERFERGRRGRGAEPGEKPPHRSSIGSRRGVLYPSLRMICVQREVARSVPSVS